MAAYSNSLTVAAAASKSIQPAEPLVLAPPLSMMEQGVADKAPETDPEQLKLLPPQASFEQLTKVCQDCHSAFRKKKK